MASTETVWTIVVAGGSGQRFGGPKQYEKLGTERIIDRSVRVAQECSHGVVVVVPAGDVAAERGVAGGATRAQSVRNGLAAVPATASVVCVHDAARPFATAALYRAVIAEVRAGASGAVPGLPLADTVKRVDERGWVIDTPDRASLVAVQTPQAFRAEALRAAHAAAGEATDDAALVEAAGGTIKVVPGDPANRKITTPADLAWARAQVLA